MHARDRAPGDHAVARGEDAIARLVLERGIAPDIDRRMLRLRRDLFHQRDELRGRERLLGDRPGDAGIVELRAVIGLEEEGRGALGHERGEEFVEMGHEPAGSREMGRERTVRI